MDDAEVLVHGVPWFQTALFRQGLRFYHVTHRNHNAVKRIDYEE